MITFYTKTFKKVTILIESIDVSEHMSH